MNLQSPSISDLSNSNHWFVCPQPNPKAATRLFFFPYTGGGPAVFSKWCREFPDDIEAWIAHYPGRGSRHNEPPIENIVILVERLSQAIQSLLDKPFAFFGHSLGGLVAFELARNLRQSNLPQPVTLFISACGAPHIADPHMPVHALPDDEFLNSLKDLNGIASEVLYHPELMQLLLPILRADFELFETYQFVSTSPIDCPIVAFGGLNDPRVSRERIEAWALYTSSHFESKFFHGDHFFINTSKESIIAEIFSSLSTLTK